jgi:uncharacterized protein with NAD-binding domain and iron-sulfur cluster
VRVRRGVTSFSPGSAAWMPPTVTPLPGVFMAGDWIQQVWHAARDAAGGGGNVQKQR